MASEKVVFLDDSEDLRVLVGALLQSRLGVESLGLARIADLDTYEARVLASQVAILDVNLGPNEPDGLDAFDWLRTHKYAGTILFLTGHARSHPRLAELSAAGIEVMEKPIKTDRLCTTVLAALNTSRGSFGGEA